MRWSEFSAKECIDLVNGERVGSLSHADCAFDPRTGKISSIFIPIRSSWLKNRGEIKIDWKMIRKVGPEMVIIDSNSSRK